MTNAQQQQKDGLSYQDKNQPVTRDKNASQNPNQGQKGYDQNDQSKKFSKNEQE